MQALVSPDGPSRARSPRLDQMTDEELDLLTHGVIALDRDGCIRRYNLAEARFARLDRAQVLGQDFFRRVGKCAATPEFEGRVRELWNGSSRDALRFDYVFDFRFGAQEVAIEAERLGDAHVYLSVRRKRLLPARAPAVARDPGVAQRELAPEEARAGVARDASDQRLVHVGPAFFEALLQTSAKPGIPADLLEECGAAWGRLSVAELEADALERFEAALRDLPMVTAAEFVSSYVKQRGWGRLSFDFAHADKGAIVLSLERSPFADVARVRGKACALLAGFLASMVSHLAQRNLAVREVRCAAEGAGSCELVVVGHAKRPFVDAAIGGGASRVADVLEVAGRAARGGR